MKKLALAITVLVAACGTLDVPLTQTRVDPGKGPFRERSAVELCLGSARLVARQGAAGATGVCVDAAESARSCGADADCAHGEACICGRCLVPGCTGTQPCGDGNVCRGDRCTRACVADADCDAGDRCAAGGCAKPCTASSECGYGGTCDKLASACAAITCASDDDCGTGRSCARVQRAGDVHEPAALPDGSILVEVREGAGKAETTSIFTATPDGDQRFRLVEPAVVTNAAGPTALATSAAPPTIFAAAPDGSALVRLVGGAPQTVLVPDRPWEGGRVASPSAVRFAGSIWLFYEVGTSAGIGVARLDASLAVVEKRGPILTPSMLESPGYFRGVDAVGAPDAVVSGDVLLLYATAHGTWGTSAFQGTTELPAAATDVVVMAATADVLRFDLAPQNPLFARRTNLRTYLGTRESMVRLSPDGATMLFVASDADGKLDGVALATEPLREYVSPDMSDLDRELEKAAEGYVSPVAVPAAPAGPKKNLGLLVGLLVVAGGITALVLNFQDAAVYAKSVDQVAADKSLVGRALRVEGGLVKGSLVHQESPCEYRFRMSEKGAEIPVRYGKCVVPDTFRDVPGMDVRVTVEGKIGADGTFEATQVMAKCPSKYEMKQKQSAGEAAPHQM
jgi:cytochrome c-type biogenesis protein CcmE